MHSTTPYVDILLAEDNPGDTLLLQDCFLRYSHLRPQFHVVDDGEAALAFLHQHDSYAEAPRPHLILLDIRLPKRDGWEVLTTIRATPEKIAQAVVQDVTLRAVKQTPRGDISHHGEVPWCPQSFP